MGCPRMHRQRTVGRLAVQPRRVQGRTVDGRVVGGQPLCIPCGQVLKTAAPVVAGACPWCAATNINGTETVPLAIYGLTSETYLTIMMNCSSQW